MAKKTVLVSDMSGKEIAEGKGATIRITFRDARKGVRELDVTDDEAERLFAEARAVADAIGVDLRLPRLEEPPPARSLGSPGCHWPFSAAYVTHDAKVQPCCMVMGADRAVLGDATEDGFADIWRGDEYGRFRDGLMGDDPPDVCRGCSLYRRLF